MGYEVITREATDKELKEVISGLIKVLELTRNHIEQVKKQLGTLEKSSCNCVCHQYGKKIKGGYCCDCIEA